MRALVTGGQRGIGLGVVRALTSAGWEVHVASERPVDHPEVAALEGLPYQVFDQGIDDPATLLDLTGTPDALILNAGIAAPARGDLLEMAPGAIRRVLAVNLEGPVRLAQAAAKRMLVEPSETPRSITFVTSISATHASVERGEYCLSKAGAAMAAQLFAARLAPHDIAVFDLRPGIVESAMTGQVRAKYDALIPDIVPARRWGTPRDAGAAVLALVSGALHFSTGAVIPVDGGLSIARL